MVAVVAQELSFKHQGYNPHQDADPQNINCLRGCMISITTSRAARSYCCNPCHPVCCFPAPAMTDSSAAHKLNRQQCCSLQKSTQPLDRQHTPVLLTTNINSTSGGTTLGAQNKLKTIKPCIERWIIWFINHCKTANARNVPSVTFVWQGSSFIQHSVNNASKSSQN